MEEISIDYETHSYQESFQGGMTKVIYMLLFGAWKPGKGVLARLLSVPYGNTLGGWFVINKMLLYERMV